MALITFMYKGKKVFSPKYDDIFKAVFLGRDKTLLASLLSSILNMAIEAKGIVVINSELPGENKEDKSVFLDLLVRLVDGSYVNVEMQVRNERDMGKRSIYNLSQVNSRQLKKKGKYHDLRPVIAINILDFDYIADSGDYQNRFRMKNVKTNAEMPDAEYLEIIFIELSKLPENAGGGMREQWIKFLSVKTGKELEMLAKQSPVMEKAKNRLVRVSASQRILFAMDKAEKHERDRISFFAAEKEDARAEGMAEGRAEGMAEGMAEGRAEGMAEGVAKGMEKGIAEAKAEDAKKMIAKGCDNAFIAEITGLSVEQIERL